MHQNSGYFSEDNFHPDETSMRVKYCACNFIQLITERAFGSCFFSILFSAHFQTQALWDTLNL